MSQRTRKSTRSRVAAVLAAPVIALTLMAPCASAAPVDTPAKCEGTIHISLLGHQTCVSSKGDHGKDDEHGGLSGLLGVVTGLLGGLLGGVLGG